jgi:ABC-type antimicrobial peptide transport system permease subunit
MLTLFIFAWKDMRHDWGRTLLAITGLAVVVFSYQILTSMAGTFNDFLTTPGASRNLVVYQGEYIDPGDATLEPSALEAARSLGPSLVTRVSPTMFRHMRINDRLIQVRAAPLEDWESVFHVSLIEGSWPSHANEIIAGEGAARANQWSVGSIVEIYGSPFRIAGIFRAPGTSFASIWMPIDQAGELFGFQHLYQGMYVQAAATADIEKVKALLQADPRLAGRYTVFFEDNYTYRNNQFMKDFRSLLTITSLLALLGVIFGIFNSTSLSLVERAREIGILRSIGFTHQIIRLFLLVTGLLQGWLAYAAGLAAAWGYVAYQQAGARVFILGVPVNFEISSSQILSGLLWTGALALLGAWVSSRRLMHLQVATLLRD